MYRDDNEPKKPNDRIYDWLNTVVFPVFLLICLALFTIGLSVAVVGTIVGNFGKKENAKVEMQNSEFVITETEASYENARRLYGLLQQRHIELEDAIIKYNNSDDLAIRAEAEREARELIEAANGIAYQYEAILFYNCDRFKYTDVPLRHTSIFKLIIANGYMRLEEKLYVVRKF